jgi:erythronate-4-phosphate dehydrogenase
MKRIRIIADDKIPFLKGLLDPYADISYFPGSQISRDIVRNADALIVRTRTRCDRSLLEGTQVKFIATATIGFDHIDTEWCHNNCIYWTNAPGCNAASVEQYLTAALLELILTEKLDPAMCTLGIVGVGNVGSKVAKAASIMGFKVLLNDPPRVRNEGKSKFTSLENIREHADIISFHVPLNKGGEDNTLGLADSDFFRQSEHPFYFINTSRGEVAVESALLKALNEGMVKKAIVDVWNNEPSINLDLLSRAFIATPHIAGYSTDGKANGTLQSVESVVKFFGLKLPDPFSLKLPVPDNNNVQLDCTGKSEVEVLREVISETYLIWNDDRQLRRDPAGFEKQRVTYPLRREPCAYNVRLINNPYEELPLKLEKLGFGVLETNCFC